MGKPITEFDQIIGHKSIIRFLQENLRRGTIKDIILLYGNSGIGKSSLAKLIAVNLVSGENKSLRDRMVKDVILDNKSNEFIKLIAMTEVADKEEEIAKVKSETSLGFSSVGKKVLIVDEVQGMSAKAQDGLLTEMEHLDDGVYIIMCTTEINKLKDAFIGRCRTRLQLHNLNKFEISQLIRQEIAHKRIKFSINMDTVITLIGYYSNFQARDAVNLISNFAEGSTVTSDDLSVFVNANSSIIIIKLIEYLYGSLTMGLDYIATMEIDNVFQESLAEVLKVAIGGTSKLLTPEEEGKLFTILKDKDINVLVHFVVDILSYSKLTSKQITSAFIKNSQSLRTVPEYNDPQSIAMGDLTTIENVAVQSDRPVEVNEEERYMRAESIDDILKRAESIIGD